MRLSRRFHQQSSHGLRRRFGGFLAGVVSLLSRKRSAKTLWSLENYLRCRTSSSGSLLSWIVRRTLKVGGVIIFRSGQAVDLPARSVGEI